MCEKMNAPISTLQLPVSSFHDPNSSTSQYCGHGSCHNQNLNTNHADSGNDHCSCHTEATVPSHTTATSSSASSNCTNSIDTSSAPELIVETCDACPYCNDTCTTRTNDLNTNTITGTNINYEEPCITCTKKMNLMDHLKEEHRRHNQKSKNKKKKLLPITQCQLRRHNNRENGIWLLCDKAIYDVTNYIQYHPGGINSILRKSGGVIDCTKDMSFHSPKAIKLWKQFQIGFLVPCPGESLSGNNDVCTNSNNSASNNRNFWNQNNSIKSQAGMEEQSDQCTIS